MNTMNKSDAKTGVDRNVNALREKAGELRRRMSADKAASIVARLEDPSDSGDLSTAVEFGTDLANIDFSYHDIGHLLDEWQARLQKAS